MKVFVVHQIGFTNCSDESFEPSTQFYAGGRAAYPLVCASRKEAEQECEAANQTMFERYEAVERTLIKREKRRCRH
jgi:hypothetical protein